MLYIDPISYMILKSVILNKYIPERKRKIMNQQIADILSNSNKYIPKRYQTELKIVVICS